MYKKILFKRSYWYQKTISNSLAIIFTFESEKSFKMDLNDSLNLKFILEI